MDDGVQTGRKDREGRGLRGVNYRGIWMRAVMCTRTTQDRKGAHGGGEDIEKWQVGGGTQETIARPVESLAPRGRPRPAARSLIHVGASRRSADYAHARHPSCVSCGYTQAFDLRRSSWSLRFYVCFVSMRTRQGKEAFWLQRNPPSFRRRCFRLPRMLCAARQGHRSSSTAHPTDAQANTCPTCLFADFCG